MELRRLRGGRGGGTSGGSSAAVDGELELSAISKIIHKKKKKKQDVF